MCTVFGWTALAAVVTFLAYFLKEIQAFFGSLFRGSYQVINTFDVFEEPRNCSLTYVFYLLSGFVIFSLEEDRRE